MVHENRLSLDTVFLSLRFMKKSKKIIVNKKKNIIVFLKKFTVINMLYKFIRIKVNIQISKVSAKAGVSLGKKAVENYIYSIAV